MIKRRYYRLEHGDKDDPSSDSSSSPDDSDSDSDPEQRSEPTDQSLDSYQEDDNISEEIHHNNNTLKEDEEPSSNYSGYESEDSSGNEIADDPSGFAREEEEDDCAGNDRKIATGNQTSGKCGRLPLNNEIAEEESMPDDVPDYVLKNKSVFKCRICPQTLCLTEETIRAHLSSKRHTRSEKLLKENKLKAILNSDGEIENQETPAERHARIVALTQEKSPKKNKGRQRQRKRLRKKKVGEDSKVEERKELKKGPVKKQRKSAS